MSDLPPVAQFLTNQAVSFKLFQHTGQVTSLEQAALERGHLPNQVVRSIVFRLAEDQYVMVLVAGPAQISWPKLRAYLGQSRITMASEEQVLGSTGYKVGAVSPLGLPGPMRILADENVFIPQEISIGSGERGKAVIIKSADLHRCIGSIEISKFTESQENVG
jgi:Cys-tRNA(Pro) deacylase